MTGSHDDLGRGIEEPQEQSAAVARGLVWHVAPRVGLQGDGREGGDEVCVGPR